MERGDEDEAVRPEGQAGLRAVVEDVEEQLVVEPVEFECKAEVIPEIVVELREESPVAKAGGPRGGSASLRFSQLERATSSANTDPIAGIRSSSVAIDSIRAPRS